MGGQVAGFIDGLLMTSGCWKASLLWYEYGDDYCVYQINPPPKKKKKSQATLKGRPTWKGSLALGGLKWCAGFSDPVISKRAFQDME